ncbi:MAG: fumarate reductase subunit C [Planctomycetes bacterium]|nr:fumarate reductase subunit C [Planctomycetota bacterium]
MKGPYIRPIPFDWFMQTAAYRRFMVRELTSVFIAGYLIFLLVFLHRAGQDDKAFGALLECLRSPVSLVLHLLVLGAALFHSITWFNLTPQAMPVRIGEERLPDALVAVLGGYLPWIVVSVVIFWGVLG